MKAASVTRIKDYGKHLGRHLGASGGIWEASGLLDGASPEPAGEPRGAAGEPPEDWTRPGRRCGQWIPEESFAS